MLELKNVTKQFEKTVAVDDVSFTVENGKVLGIVGRNGAGKSTIFRMILGLIEPNSGEILFDGKKIDSKTLDTFGFLPEEGSLLPQHTVLDICEYYASLKLLPKEVTLERLKNMLKEFHIESYLNMKAKALSKGNRQKIQFIISILLEKQILKLKEQGKTIIFSSHIMSHVENICDDVLLLNHGKPLLYGNLKEIKSNYMINGEPAKSFNDIFIDKVGEENE